MKKVIIGIFIMSFVAAVAPVGAQVNMDHPLMQGVPGDYVIYRDHRGEETAYLGFMQLEEGSLLIRFLEPDSGAYYLAIMDLQYEPDPVVTQVRVLASNLNQSEERFFIADVSNIATQRNRLSSRDFHGVTDLKDVLPMDWGTLWHVYDSWIPVFQLQRTTRDGTGETLLELVTFGRAADIQDPRFYRFEGIPEHAQGPDYVVDQGPVSQRHVGVLPYSLGERWIIPEGANLATLPGHTPRDAALESAMMNLEQLDVTDSRIMARLLLIGTALENFVLAETVVLRYVDHQAVHLEYSVHDSQSGLRTFIRHHAVQFSPGRWHMTTLMAFEDLYTRNRELLDAVLR